MDLAIDRKNGIPIYIQIKTQIEEHVQRGLWKKGTRLPTERELAEMLGISRTTASSAYRRLEADGLVVSYQGRGTFVVGPDTVVEKKGRRERLLRAVDSALEQALALGFTVGEFINIASTRAREKEKLLSRVRVGFVECNREQVEYFARELESTSGVAVVPILLEGLRNRGQEISRALAHTSLVITTFFHIGEVKKLLPNREVVAIALDADIETIVRIARCRARVFGLVCLSDAFAAKVRQSILEAGLADVEIIHSTSRKTEELESFVRSVEALIVSPGRKKDVESVVPPGMSVIEFVYRPDVASVNLIKSALVELREK